MEEQNDFMKYPSLCKQLNPPRGSAREVEWVATEKVHGANFQIDFNHKTFKVTPCRRNGVINEGENFFSYKAVVWTQMPYIINLTKQLEGSFKIYGELYGGGYDNADKDKKWSFEGMVQNEILYTYFYDFVVFDIFHNGRWLDYDEVVRLCKLCEFDVVPELCRGTYADVVNFNTEKLLTKVPEFDKLPPIEDNYMEGKVIRPVKEPQMSKDSEWPRESSTNVRQIYKVVNDHYFEKKHNCKQKIKKSHRQIQEELKVELEKILPYVTRNRFNNVRSKELPIENLKEVKKYIDLMVKDIKTEVENDKIEVDERAYNLAKEKLPF